MNAEFLVEAFASGVHLVTFAGVGSFPSILTVIDTILHTVLINTIGSTNADYERGFRQVRAEIAPFVQNSN